MSSIFKVALIAAAAALWSLPAYGQLSSSQPEWINALRQGGHVIVFRHGATHTPLVDGGAARRRRGHSSSMRSNRAGSARAG
jgi:hypothetical protein